MFDYEASSRESGEGRLAVAGERALNSGWRTESGEIKGVARRKERVWWIERSGVTAVRQGRSIENREHVDA